MKNKLIQAVFTTVQESVASLRGRISNVKPAPFDGQTEKIYFSLDKDEYIGELKGRNKFVLIGFGDSQDKAIACRVFLDGDAKKI